MLCPTMVCKRCRPGHFLLPGIKKASRGGEPVFSMAEGDQQTPSALLGDDFFVTVEKPSGFFGLLFVFRFFLGLLLLVFRLLALVNVLHLPVHLKNRLGA